MTANMLKDAYRMTFSNDYHNFCRKRNTDKFSTFLFVLEIIFATNVEFIVIVTFLRHIDIDGMILSF